MFNQQHYVLSNYRIKSRQLPSQNNPNTKRCSLGLNEKLEIAIYKGHNLNKRSDIINKCHHWNKFLLALSNSKDWIEFSVTDFEQTSVRGHSFPGSDCFKSSWIQLIFGNQCFHVVVSLISSHAHEVTVSLSLVDSQLMWD